MIELLLNWVRFGCTHPKPSLPYFHTQFCFKCGAERFHNFSFIGEWRKPSRKAA